MSHIVRKTDLHYILASRKSEPIDRILINVPHAGIIQRHNEVKLLTHGDYIHALDSDAPDGMDDEGVNDIPADSLSKTPETVADVLPWQRSQGRDRRFDHRLSGCRVGLVKDKLGKEKVVLYRGDREGLILVICCVVTFHI